LYIKAVYRPLSLTTMHFTRLVPFVLLLSIQGQAQQAAGYLEKIRDNTALLTAFFAQMPKGGDLHHHYSGSVYGETYVEYVIEKDFFINKTSLDVSEKTLPGDWFRFSELKKEGTLVEYKQRLLQKWSVKDYNGIDNPAPDDQFFETFPRFSAAAKATLEKGLLELKNRAKKENVSYIETIFSSPACEVTLADPQRLNNRLRNIQEKRDLQAAVKLLDTLYQAVISKNIRACAVQFATGTVDRLHRTLAIDDSRFTMRYQSYVSRHTEPVDLFKNLIAAFEAASADTLIVGVNIVAREDNEIAMKDYWLHMVMFRFCHGKYPTVKQALHAGELTLGIVRPEDLTWHIQAAVHIAGANRIGHGVDIAYEEQCYGLLDYMRVNQIPVEINLYSNEFILKVKNERHPIALYRQFDVPIVICTDDAGVLRSNLTDQYVLLANRYRNITYADIKQCVYNSIKYSFIENDNVKARLIKDLDARFAAFEGLFDDGKVKSPKR
jgi:adenosine deaminase